MRRFGKRILSRLCERLPMNTSPARPRRMMKTLLCWNREKWACTSFWLVDREHELSRYVSSGFAGTLVGFSSTSPSHAAS
jgi:hypothetical protein